MGKQRYGGDADLEALLSILSPIIVQADAAAAEVERCALIGIPPCNVGELGTVTARVDRATFDSLRCNGNIELACATSARIARGVSGMRGPAPHSTRPRWINLHKAAYRRDMQVTVAMLPELYRAIEAYAVNQGVSAKVCIGVLLCVGNHLDKGAC